MEYNICDKCQLAITDNPLCCDGICGSKFHRDCARRFTRQFNGYSYTCASCMEVKPCHILKAFLVLNEKLEAIHDKTSDLEQMIINMKSDFSTLLSDRETILTRVDHLLDNNRSLEEVLSKFADLANKNNLLMKQLDNTLSDIDLSPDLSSIRQDLDMASGSLRVMEERLRALTDHPGLSIPTTPPPPVPTRACIIQSELPASQPTMHPPPEVDLNTPPSHANPASNMRDKSVEEPRSPSLSPSGDPYPAIPDPPSITWIPNGYTESTSLYIGRCHPFTSPESISDFVSSRLGIPAKSVRSRKLVNPNRPLSEFSFVSFKVDIPSTMADLALSCQWPSPSRVSLFKSRKKHGSDRLPCAHPQPSKNLCHSLPQGMT